LEGGIYMIIKYHIIKGSTDKESLKKDYKLERPEDLTISLSQLDKAKYTVIATDDNEIVGIGGYIEIGKFVKSPFLFISVVEDHRRKGIGTEIMSYIIIDTSMNKYLNLTLSTEITREPAIKLYEKLQFNHYIKTKNHVFMATNYSFTGSLISWSEALKFKARMTIKGMSRTMRVDDKGGN
jgi:ribosomal protein S18 acetylase RimI-like enzyme